MGKWLVCYSEKESEGHRFSDINRPKKVKELGDALDDFRSGAWEQYGVDAYIITTYPANNKHYSHYLSDCAYWLDKFGGTRRDRSGKKHSKGFLEIFY